MTRYWLRRVRAAWRAYCSWTLADEQPCYSPKAMIETLSIAQARISASALDQHRAARDIGRLQHLINRYEGQRHRSRR